MWFWTIVELHHPGRTTVAKVQLLDLAGSQLKSGNLDFSLCLGDSCLQCLFVARRSTGKTHFTWHLRTTLSSAAWVHFSPVPPLITTTSHSMKNIFLMGHWLQGLCANHWKGPPLSKHSPLLWVLGWLGSSPLIRCPLQGPPGSSHVYLTPKMFYDYYKLCTYLYDIKRSGNPEQPTN